MNRDIEDGVHVRQDRYFHNGGGAFYITARRGKRLSISIFRKCESADEAWAIGMAAYAQLKRDASGVQ